MADDKKKPTAPPPSNYMEEIIFLLAGLIILGVIANRFMVYFESIPLYFTFWPFWSIWKVIAVVITAACLPWVIYSYKKLSEINKAEAKTFGAIPKDSFLEEGRVAEKQNERWVRVMEHANSNNPSDWRLAIIEADVMLDELLRIKGFFGEGVGERLKSVGPGEIQNLEAAWEAHKVRNRIAHSGEDFQLSERETRHTIALFESVFLEFGVI